MLLGSTLCQRSLPRSSMWDDADHVFSLFHSAAGALNYDLSGAAPYYCPRVVAIQDWYLLGCETVPHRIGYRLSAIGSPNRSHSSCLVSIASLTNTHQFTHCKLRHPQHLLINTLFGILRY